MRRKDYTAKMSALGLWVAYGVSNCKAGGHSLRDRAGHCVQCKPANLGFLRRYDEDGEVYVAISGRGSLVKVGMSKKAVKRISQLNFYEYGGRSDWSLHFVVQCIQAGKVENSAQQKLAKFASSGTYYKSGNYIECQELFTCRTKIAVIAVKGSIQETSSAT